jgi:hypothetical protein
VAAAPALPSATVAASCSARGVGSQGAPRLASGGLSLPSALTPRRVWCLASGGLPLPSGLVGGAGAVWPAAATKPRFFLATRDAATCQGPPPRAPGCVHAPLTALKPGAPPPPRALGGLCPLAGTGAVWAAAATKLRFFLATREALLGVSGRYNLECTRYNILYPIVRVRSRP